MISKVKKIRDYGKINGEIFDEKRLFLGLQNTFNHENKRNKCKNCNFAMITIMEANGYKGRF